MEIIILIVVICVVVKKAKEKQMRQGTRPNVPRQQTRPNQQMRPAQGYQTPQQAYRAAQAGYGGSQQAGQQAYRTQTNYGGTQQTGYGGAQNRQTGMMQQMGQQLWQAGQQVGQQLRQAGQQTGHGGAQNRQTGAMQRAGQQARPAQPNYAGSQQRGKKQQPQANDILVRAASNVNENEYDELEMQMLEGGQTLANAIDIDGTSALMEEVNDLMIMGYRADLSFERDFVAEGVAMLNSYQLPTEN